MRFKLVRLVLSVLMVERAALMLMNGKMRKIVKNMKYASTLLAVGGVAFQGLSWQGIMTLALTSMSVKQAEW